MDSAGIYGIAFSPYVGPWRTDGPVLFKTYTLDQVTPGLGAVLGLSDRCEKARDRMRVNNQMSR